MRKIFLISLLLASPLNAAPTPKLTIAIVIDQMGTSYVRKHKEFLSGGIKKLLTKGVVYTEARHPHAITATGPGHVALSTGTTAKDHGIVSNHWFDETGKKKIPFTSAKQIFVDGLSDQVVLSEKNFGPVYAFSLKDRAAVALASNMGKGVWFDEDTGKLTSSSEYFDTLPEWLQQFNKDFSPQKPMPWRWDTAYPVGSGAYGFDNAFNDKYSDYNVTRTGDTLTIAPKLAGKKEKPFRNFTRTPSGHAMLLDAVKACVDNHLEQHPNKDAFMWVSLSGLDQVGHIMGPDHITPIDMLYHLDKQLDRFIDDIQAKVSEGEVCFMLSGDHGTMPIVDLLKDKGMKAHRVNVFKLMDQMNEAVTQKHGIEGLVQSYKSEQFFFDKTIWHKLPRKERSDIVHTLKAVVRKEPGIREVWTPLQLRILPVEKGTVESFFREQLYRDRSGDLIVLTHPYVDVTKHATGTGHTMPYNYNQHVPLAFYQPGRFEKKHIHRPVTMLQVAPTLARILHVPRPSAARKRVLPRLFKSVH